MRLSKEIDDLLTNLVDLARDKAKKEHRYGIKKAKETLLASTKTGSGRGGGTTVDEREAHVRVACDTEWLEHLLAETLYETCRERIHAKRDQIKSLQTISANIRALT